MALIMCPECKKEVSSAAENCIHCGYPISKYLQLQRCEPDTRKLVEKVLPCDFTVPSPRAKVCLKCTKPFSSVCDNSFRKPSCKCGMPGVEIDYQEAYSGRDHLPTQAYILENCVLPRNIGDYTSDEYNAYVNKMYADMDKINISGERTPPNPEYFGIDHSMERSKAHRLPTCPVCGSTNLSKLTATKSFLKIATFGIAGAGDVGKTWKCNKCGSKI